MLITAFHQTIENIKNQSSVAFSGIVTTSFSLVIIGSIFLIYSNGINFSRFFFQKSHYSLFLKKESTSSQKVSITQEVNAILGVYDVVEIGPEQAKQELLESFGEARKILKNVPFSKLPSIIEFSLQRKSPLTDAEKKRLIMTGGIDEIVSGQDTKDLIDIFFSISNFVGIFFIIMSVVCITIIIRNSIQIGIRIRLKEIEILKVLGATKWFIRLPYVFEGILIAITSFFLSIGLTYYLFQFILAGITFNEATYGIEKQVTFFSALELLIVFISLVFLGISSSILATDKIIMELGP